MAKILVPFFAPLDTFAGDVAATLRAMGHEVVQPRSKPLHERSRVSYLSQRLIETLKPDWPTPYERRALSIARAEGPFDLLFCTTRSFSEEILYTLKKYGVKQAIIWWGDPPANIPKNSIMSDAWDAIFIKDRAAARKLAGVGLNAHHLHEAINPDIHQKNFDEINDRVAVVGNYYGFRQMLVRRLIERKIPVDLFGFPPPRWSHPDILARHSGRYVKELEKSRVFGSALASLNCTTMAEGNCLNCRAFEIAGACGLQLIEDKPAVQECFEPGKEVLVYRTVDDIEAHLERAKADPDWAMTVRQAGHKRAHAQHTYRQRLTHILETLGIPPLGE
ncbi:MAG: glycosyltransferase [Pseudomonadota bacterium]